MGILGLFKKKDKEKEHVFVHDKAEYQWESAVEEYCALHGIAEEELDFDELDEETETVIWEFAGNHIAFFLIWLIQNDFYKAEEIDEEGLRLIKEERIGGVDFLMNYCDGVLPSIFMKDEILDFVDEYYEGNGYFRDYCKFIEEEMRETVLRVRFSWEMYHQFAPVIDNAYQAFISHR